MRRIPTFHGLRAFEAAARLGSFLLASEELHLTPSAVSHQIKGLEKYFERALFVRLHRQVELTREGERLFAQIANAFGMIETACAELAPSSPAEQRLSLHCAPSLASNWLGLRLQSFMKQHPAINLHLSASADPVDLVRQEGLDMAIVYGKPPGASGVVHEGLGAEAIAALAAPCVAARCDVMNPVSWQGLILIDSSISPVRWPDWFALNGLESPKVARPSFDRGALALLAAVQGLGIALESTRFAQAELAGGELVRVGGGRFRDISCELHFLCYRAAQRGSVKIRAFRQWLLDAIAADPE